MTQVLSRRETGWVAGCSHVAIGKAILRGDLSKLSNGGVDPIARALDGQPTPGAW
jgi:hypothetical protein